MPISSHHSYVWARFLGIEAQQEPIEEQAGNK